MKKRNHGLSEKEMELVQLLMADCESTGDIQAKLKKLFAVTPPNIFRRNVMTAFCHTFFYTPPIIVYIFIPASPHTPLCHHIVCKSLFISFNRGIWERMWLFVI